MPESEDATELIAFEIWAPTCAPSFELGVVAFWMLYERMFSTLVVSDAGRTPTNCWRTLFVAVWRVVYAPPGLVKQASEDVLPFCWMASV